MKKKLSKLLAVCFMLVYGLFFMESQDILAAANTEMNIYAMYLNHADKGDSVLIESKGKYLLMDIGTGNHAAAIIDQLQTLGVRQVDIYFSHLHGDHTGTANGDLLAGLSKIVNAGIDIGTLYLPDQTIAPLSVSYASKYTELERFMADKGDVVYLKVGSTFSVGDVSGKVIGPVGTNNLNPDMYSNRESDEDDNGDVKYTYYENNCSLVSVLTCGNTKFFTAGDMLEDEAGYLAKKYGSKLKCDIMKLSHHGTGSGNTEELINAVSPSYSFASNTGLTGVVSSTKQWETKTAIKYSSEHGVCYMVGSQKKTVIYQVKNDVIKMYTGNKITEGKYLTGWQVFVGADGKSRKIDRYYFDKNGKPLTGVQYLDGHYYYFGDGGCMEYGNYDENGKYQYWKSYGEKKRYYTFSSDKQYAYMTVGFREISGALYYFEKDGIKLEGNGKTEKIKIGNKYYAVGQSGAITRSNWGTIGKDKYYFGKTGSMQSNYKVKIGKNYYLFGSEGKMLRASSGRKMVTFSGKKYCVGTSGAVIVNDWVTVGSAKYYCGKDGTVQKNTIIKIGKDKYYFGKDGKMVRAEKGKKLIKIGKKTYCAGTSGALTVNNWSTVGKNKYYFGKTGEMCKNKKIKKSKKYYYFDADGKMVRKVRVKIGKNYYYFGSSGEMYTNKYVKIKGKRYYCDKNGVMKAK